MGIFGYNSAFLHYPEFSVAGLGVLGVSQALFWKSFEMFENFRIFFHHQLTLHRGLKILSKFELLAYNMSVS